MNRQPQITLAIESAICGGSIALLSEDTEVASWISESSVSKAEDLLVNVNALLTQNNILPRDLDLVAVSAGPGSFTGIRIGIATDLGLKAGLGVAMSSESALRAMAFTQPEASNVVAALPVGRNAVCLQSFKMCSKQLVDLERARTITETEFEIFVKKAGVSLLHANLYHRVPCSSTVVNFGSNIALAIGRICRQNRPVTEPLFISKQL